MIDTPIVKPVKGIHSPILGPVAVMAAPKPDLKLLIPALGLSQVKPRPLFIGRLYVSGDSPGTISLAGPFLGAPHAAMVMETLVSWGAKQLVFVGWCGSLTAEVGIGDVVIPTGGIVDEGTSPHYHVAPGEISHPSALLMGRLQGILKAESIRCHQGLVWTTDGAFQETPEKVLHFKSRQALAVEMEVSCLFSVANHLGVDAAGILVVSDELFSMTWNPGFKKEAFKAGRARVIQIVETFCRELGNG
jgi:purine-nucleoside phosphorylase